MQTIENLRFFVFSVDIFMKNHKRNRIFVYLIIYLTPPIFTYSKVSCLLELTGVPSKVPLL